MERQLEYLIQEIDERLRSRGSSVEYYRRRHYWFQTILLIVAGAIPVLSGVNLGFLHSAKATVIPPILTNIVLVLGAASTGMAAYGAFFSPQESWHLNAKVYANLLALKSKLEFAALGADFKVNESAIVKELFANYQNILDDYNQKWQALRQKSK